MVQPQYSQSTAQLITYRPQQQHAGMLVSGFDWRLYGTGTFRKMPTNHEAEIYLNRFVRQLGDSLHFHKDELAYYAALEDKTPGLGGTPVRKHWHFLLACPDNPYLLSCGKQLWEASNGWITIQPFDRGQAAGYYINKLISNGATTYERNLERSIIQDRPI